MNHGDHVRLLHAGVPAAGGTWADLGSGGGAFTLALADLLGPGGEIYSVDKDGSALREQERLMRERFPTAEVHYRAADFTRPLELPPLDGIVMANALHFHRDKERVIRLVKEYLKPGGRLLLVEYNVDQGNIWVPHPLAYPAWEALAARCGFAHTRQLGTQPSRFLREMYSAESI
jgi:SAM-dependent methyltransferase